jgi:hypothetical protein
MSLEQPLDLAGPYRLAILANTDITALLGTWSGEPAVFTRRPVPTDAPYPMVVISPPISVGDQDYLSARIPVVRTDLAVYGQLGAPGTDQYRVVEAIAYMLRQQFHRQKGAITPNDAYRVVEIVATGPMPAPVDDAKEIGRAVLLRTKLQEFATA